MAPEKCPQEREHCPELLTFLPKFFFLVKMLRGEIKGVIKNEV